MNPKNDEQFDFQTDEQFAKDLRLLFEPAKSVRPEIDRAVMDAAARHLKRPHRSRRWAYWAGCAAAAMIVAGVLLLDFNPQKHNASVALKNDVNRDGAVNILDAFKLAQQIGANAEIDPKWDTNGDGVVDQKDVDAVAMVAVRLKEGVL